MMIFYYNEDKANHARMIRYLYDSYDGAKKIFKTSEFNANVDINLKAKILIFAGMIRGEGLIYRWCQSNSKEFLYLDHAYLGRGYNANDPNSEWMRITKSGFVWSSFENRSYARWQSMFSKDYRLSPWRSNGGKKILVLPPSTATKFIFDDCDVWMDQTMRLLKSKFDEADIVIREKPHQVVVDTKTNKIVSRIDHKHARTIEQEMEDARLIVTYSSAVPVTGMLMGIPCYTSKNAAAYPVSCNIDNIDDPLEPDRMSWIQQLVYHQYTVAEMKSGEFWKMLREDN